MPDCSRRPVLAVAPGFGSARLLEQAQVGNTLLRMLAPADYEALQPHLERIVVRPGDELAALGGPLRTAFFPEGAIAGLLGVLSDGRRVTIGLVGREGCLGWPLLMGYEDWPYDVRVVAETSTAVRMDALRLRSLAEERSGLRSLLLRFAGVFAAQMGSTIVSNAVHGVERRTARWILLYCDRVGSDEIAITHEELGFMLSVRRASVTEALHSLEGEDLIRSSRGRVLVRDRERLETLAAETYGFAEAEYSRLIGTGM